MIKNAVKWKLWSTFFRLDTQKKIVFVPIAIIRNKFPYVFPKTGVKHRETILNI